LALPVNPVHFCAVENQHLNGELMSRCCSDVEGSVASILFVLPVHIDVLRKCFQNFGEVVL